MPIVSGIIWVRPYHYQRINTTGVTHILGKKCVERTLIFYVVFCWYFHVLVVFRGIVFRRSGPKMLHAYVRACICICTAAVAATRRGPYVEYF